MDEQLAVRPDDLIVIKQLPVIEDRLDEAFLAVKDRLSAMSGLVVTDDNYKELKKTRADLNKEFSELEKLRKKVKEAVEAPYKKFENGAYKRLADEYKNAIGKLDGDIKDVEGGLKRQKQEELFAYYEEYRQSLGLDAAIADAQRSGIKVGLSGTMKSLKEQAKLYLDGIDGDLTMIETLDNSDEVLAEYRECLSVTDAVRIVADRHKRIEEERKRREADEEARRQREAKIAEVDAAGGAEDVSEEVSASEGWLASPSVNVAVEQSDEPEQQILSTTYLGYRVDGTLEQLKGLKGYLQEALMEYCEMEGLKYGAC